MTSYEEAPPSSSNTTRSYSAIQLLMILGDSLDRVDKMGIISHLKSLQLSNGCFVPAETTNESDMRFLYCAVAISYLLNDFSGININQAVAYISSCQTFDGGIAQSPGQESHGGSVYCGLAALKMLNRLDAVDVDKIKRWCLLRHQTGFQGRINKHVDTCYAFWIGASLKILECDHLIDTSYLFSFLSLTETKYGGFGKEEDDLPDVLHSYMGLAGLSLFGHPDLSPLNPELNLCQPVLNRYPHC